MCNVAPHLEQVRKSGVSLQDTLDELGSAGGGNLDPYLLLQEWYLVVCLLPSDRKHLQS